MTDLGTSSFFMAGERSAVSHRLSKGDTDQLACP